VANAVLDGADCVMLSEETAMGNFPVETVTFMGRIAEEAESLLAERKRFSGLPMVDNTPDFLSYSACLMAERTDAEAIVAHSVTGKAGRSLSSYRPRQPVFILTPDATVLRHLNFSWGVTPCLADESIPGHLQRAEKYIESSPRFLAGTNIIITAGQTKEGTPAQGTNLVKIYRK
jgi:pyruvate kinase